VSLHDNVRQQLLGQLQTPRADGVAQLNEALRLLAKWRSGPTPWLVMCSRAAG